MKVIPSNEASLQKKEWDSISLEWISLQNS